MSLSLAQVDQLLQPIKPKRVLKDRDGLSHVAAFDVIAHMNRVFGFGNWDTDIVSLDLVREHTEETEKNGKKRAGWWVTYRCVLRLTVRDPDGRELCHYEDAATGSAQNMPFFGDAHDFASKNAVSYAIKRCAKNLGDQFGLSLYNKGQTSALVVKTLVRPYEMTLGVAPEGDIEEHAPAPESLGNDERVVIDAETGEVLDG